MERRNDMSAIDPAGEKIARNLQQAVERLQDDIARVEIWAGALGCFTRPIPDYGHGRTEFELPQEPVGDRPDTAAQRSETKPGSAAHGQPPQL
jgi:hypothetical protein